MRRIIWDNEIYDVASAEVAALAEVAIAANKTAAVGEAIAAGLRASIRLNDRDGFELFSRASERLAVLLGYPISQAEAASRSLREKHFGVSERARTRAYIL